MYKVKLYYNLVYIFGEILYFKILLSLNLNICIYIHMYLLCIRLKILVH